MRKKKWVFSYLLSLAFGVLLLLIPLLRDVHLESAFLVSILITFWGGWKSARLTRNKDLKLLCKGFIYLLMIVLPLLLHGLINDCLTLDGLMIWALLPIPSLFLELRLVAFTES